MPLENGVLPPMFVAFTFVPSAPPVAAVASDDVSLLRAGLPDARVARIPGGAHGVPFDRHSEMDARVIAWLRGVFGAGQVGVRGGSG